MHLLAGRRGRHDEQYIHSMQRLSWSATVLQHETKTLREERRTLTFHYAHNTCTYWARWLPDCLSSCLPVCSSVWPSMCLFFLNACFMICPLQLSVYLSLCLCSIWSHYDRHRLDRVFDSWTSCVCIQVCGQIGCPVYPPSRATKLATKKDWKHDVISIPRHDPRHKVQRICEQSFVLAMQVLRS